jgi:hypothetical protein
MNHEYGYIIIYYNLYIILFYGYIIYNSET